MFFKRKKNKDFKEDIVEIEEIPVVEEIEATQNSREDIEIEVNSEETVDETVVEEVSNIETVVVDDEETEAITEEETPEKTVEDDDTDDTEYDNDKPIYILGDNALACYLAIKLIGQGEKIVIIADKKSASSLSNNGITMVESHNLQKSHHKFETNFWLKETPKMLIITSEANKINAAITSISRKKILNIPIVLFTPIKDTLYIKNILENDVYRAFFDGYLLQKPGQINLYGRAPSISLCPKGSSKKNKLVVETFKKAGLIVKEQKDEIRAFWEYFSVYTACSLISAAHNKNIFDVIKDKDKRDLMIPLIVEICKIANSDGADINQEDILKKVYNTPLSYPYPLQIELGQGRAGDVDLISSNIINTARKYKCLTTEVSALLKKIYNIILA